MFIYDFLKPMNSRLLIRVWHFLLPDRQDTQFGASSLSSPWSPGRAPWKDSWERAKWKLSLQPQKNILNKSLPWISYVCLTLPRQVKPVLRFKKCFEFLWGFFFLNAFVSYERTSPHDFALPAWVVNTVLTLMGLFPSEWETDDTRQLLASEISLFTGALSVSLTRAEH